jgi:CheY-like chemotaxis protein
MMQTGKPLPAVLYIEDDDISREIVVMFLKNSYEVDTATDSGEAVKKLAGRKYSAVLMDINLGRGLSGLELAKGIKKMEGYKDVPLIAVTAFALREDEKLIMSSGCTHYITKPFTKNALLDLLYKATADTGLKS